MEKRIQKRAHTHHTTKTLKRLLDVFFFMFDAENRWNFFYVFSFLYTLLRFELELEIYVAEKAAFEENCQT